MSREDSALFLLMIDWSKPEFGLPGFERISANAPGSHGSRSPAVQLDQSFGKLNRTMKIENVDGNREVKMTSIIRRRVRSGCEREFELWTKGIAGACQKFEGYLGTRLIHPTDSSEPYVTILSFDSYQNYRTWITSDVREGWLKKVEKCTEGVESIEELSGFDYWLGVETDKARSWPPSFKMIMAAYIAILPLVSFVLPALKPFMPNHPVVSTLLSTGVITLLMGYISLPLVARIFRKWLVT